MLCVLWGVTATLFAESPLQNPSEAATAANAIGYLKTAGEAWKDQQGCVSCHQIPAMLWSLSAAESQGLAVSADELNGWKNWSTTVANFVKPSQQTDLNVDETLAGNIDTMAALMLAIPDQVRTSDDAPWREQFANKLCAEQAEDGSWKACGQLPAQRRPKQETAQATTLWVTLALLRHHTDEFDLDSAIQFADAGPEAQSTEWYAARLLVAAESESELASVLAHELSQPLA